MQKENIQFHKLGHIVLYSFRYLTQKPVLLHLAIGILRKANIPVLKEKHKLVKTDTLSHTAHLQGDHVGTVLPTNAQIVHEELKGVESLFLAHMQQ